MTENLEIRGLAAVITSGSVGGLTMPPRRESYGSGSEFEDAYESWWRVMNFWHANRTDA